MRNSDCVYKFLYPIWYKMSNFTILQYYGARKLCHNIPQFIAVCVIALRFSTEIAGFAIVG